MWSPFSRLFRERVPSILHATGWEQLARFPELPVVMLALEGEQAELLQRIGPGRDRIEDRGEVWRGRVRAGFLGAAKDHPGPIVVVDGSGGVDEVSARLQSEVTRALAVAPRS